MANTPNYGIPKPDPAANVDDEFIRLQTAWDMLDAILFTLQGIIAGKASIGHGHAIEDIIGLAAALAGKMPASRTFSLADLTDVEGVAAAPVNYVLVKNASGKWVPSTAIAAIGEHQHPMLDILGLMDTLADLQAQINNRATNADLLKAIPVGSTIFVDDTVAPPGFLKRNGALLSRTSYAALFAKIGTRYGVGNGVSTFALPDDRGLFIRSWDDGRGVDAGRAFGSYQASQNLSHGHGVNDPGHVHGVNDPGHAHGYPDRVQGRNVSNLADGGTTMANGTDVGRATNAALTGIWLSAAATGISIQLAGGAEARPQSTALLSCIKY